MKTREQRQATDRANAVTDAAEVFAEYIRAYGHDDKLFEDARNATWIRLEEMTTEEAKERYLDAKAEEQGMRY